jgi:hypothetical protein
MGIAIGWQVWWLFQVVHHHMGSVYSLTAFMGSSIMRLSETFMRCWEHIRKLTIWLFRCDILFCPGSSNHTRLHLYH